MALTPKQKRFADEYLIDLNATQAYRRAGYSVKSDNVAAVEAYKLLRNPKIAAYIAERQQAREQRTEITQDMVLQELAKIGFANISDYLKVSTEERVVGYKDSDDEEGNTTQTPILDFVQSVQLYDTEDVERVKLDAVAEIKQTKDGVSFKLHDKVAALEKIGRHLGMFKDKMELTGESGGPINVIFSPKMRKSE